MIAPLVIAFTPNYLVPAAVTLRSILDATEDAADRYEVICLVSEEIPQRQKEMLERMVGTRMNFNYLQLKGALEGYYVDPRYSEAASYRLLLPELLPELNSVIYIDCDVVVRQNLAELYRETELGDNLLAAVHEAPIEKQSERWSALGCDPNRYFNSGFLLINLAQMRAEGTSAKLLEALKADYLEFPDQDALNVVCRGRVLPLSPVFNSIRTFFIPRYRKEFEAQYGDEMWDKVQNEGTIHYTGGKPWNLFTIQFGEWWRVYRTLPAEIKGEWHPSPRIKMLADIYLTKAGRWCIDAARSISRRIKR